MQEVILQVYKHILSSIILSDFNDHYFSLLMTDETDKKQHKMDHLNTCLHYIKQAYILYPR